MLAHLARLIQASGTGFREMRAAHRPGGCVLYMWESLARGKECGQLQRQQVKLGGAGGLPGLEQDRPARTERAHSARGAGIRKRRLVFVEAAVQALLHGMEEARLSRWQRMVSSFAP